MNYCLWQRQEQLFHLRVIGCTQPSNRIPATHVTSVLSKVITKQKTYPSTAWKPSLSQPRFVPFTISFNTSGWAYMTGVMNPIGPYPAAKRSRFNYANQVSQKFVIYHGNDKKKKKRHTRVKILANVGLAKLVPNQAPSSPCTKAGRYAPLELTSGYPLPIRLYRPVVVFRSGLNSS